MGLTVYALQVSGDPATCFNVTTLDCLRVLYNFNYTLQVPEQHSLGVGVYTTAYIYHIISTDITYNAVEFGSVILNYTDLDLFFEQFDTAQVGKRPAFFGIDGGTCQSVLV